MPTVTVQLSLVRVRGYFRWSLITVRAAAPNFAFARRRLELLPRDPSSFTPLPDGRSLVLGSDRARNLEDGATARVSSSAGSLEAPVEVSDEMRPGVVCLPHGWGHDKQGARLSVASRHAGVCNNVLAPGDFVDAASGNAIVNGIPVEVAPA